MLRGRLPDYWRAAACCSAGGTNSRLAGGLVIGGQCQAGAASEDVQYVKVFF